MKFNSSFSLLSCLCCKSWEGVRSVVRDQRETAELMKYSHAAPTNSLSLCYLWSKSWRMKGHKCVRVWGQCKGLKRYRGAIPTSSLSLCCLWCKAFISVSASSLFFLSASSISCRRPSSLVTVARVLTISWSFSRNFLVTSARREQCWGLSSLPHNVVFAITVREKNKDMGKCWRNAI